MVVEGILWAAAVRGIEPLILSFGAAFAAFGLDNLSKHDRYLFDMKEMFGKLPKRFLFGDHNKEE